MSRRTLLVMLFGSIISACAAAPMRFYTFPADHVAPTDLNDVAILTPKGPYNLGIGIQKVDGEPPRLNKNEAIRAVLSLAPGVEFLFLPGHHSIEVSHFRVGTRREPETTTLELTTEPRKRYVLKAADGYVQVDEPSLVKESTKVFVWIVENDTGRIVAGEAPSKN